MASTKVLWHVTVAPCVGRNLARCLDVTCRLLETTLQKLYTFYTGSFKVRKVKKLEKTSKVKFAVFSIKLTLSPYGTLTTFVMSRRSPYKVKVNASAVVMRCPKECITFAKPCAAVIIKHVATNSPFASGNKKHYNFMSPLLRNHWRMTK